MCLEREEPIIFNYEEGKIYHDKYDGVVVVSLEDTNSKYFNALVLKGVDRINEDDIDIKKGEVEEIGMSRPEEISIDRMYELLGFGNPIEVEKGVYKSEYFVEPDDEVSDFDRIQLDIGNASGELLDAMRTFNEISGELIRSKEWKESVVDRVMRFRVELEGLEIELRRMDF